MTGRASKKRATKKARALAKRVGGPASHIPSSAREKRAKSVTSSQHGEQRGRQVIRHLKILAALSHASRGLSVTQLREVTDEDCTIRTLYRDLEHLQAAGFALTSDDGRWSANPNAQIHAPVQPEELLALILAEQALSAGGATPHAAPLSTLRSKLHSALTPNARAYCEELAQFSIATAFGPNIDDALEPVAGAIREAIAKLHALAITYETPGKPAGRRIVEPYATWIAGGRPYLVGFCRTAGEVRTFALVRIHEAAVLDEEFEPDPTFNVADFAGKGVGVYHGAVHRIVLELAPEVAHLAKERTLHRTQSVESLSDGRALLRIEAAGLPEIAAWVASFGGKARAVEPPELVEMVRALFTQGAEAHSGGA